MKTSHAIENATILELCKFLDADKSKINAAFSSELDLQYILGQLLFNRIGGVAYYTLRECGLLPEISKEFRNPLKMVYESSIEKTKSFLAAENMLAELFKGLKADMALLKGAYLAQLYPKGLRISNDFDLLIKKHDIEDFSFLLLKSGFEQGYLEDDVFKRAKRDEVIYAFMSQGGSVPFVKRIGLPQLEYMAIDVSFALGFQTAKNSESANHLLQNTEKLIVTDHGLLPTLSKVLFLVHLCANLYKRAATYDLVGKKRDISLYRFCDIYLFITTFMHHDFAAELIDAIEEMDLHQECYFALHHTRSLFGLHNKFLDAVLDTIQPEDLSFMNQVFDASTQKVFQYETDFSGYVFHANRMSLLKEV
ncbi:MAG: nucleotidyltransferase family protein [Oscillospiraceae bacterium]|jgi:hypothetical protein|nr:nucleotidyltransferase family protein [Oscillospiraceae bacterium]